MGGAYPHPFEKCIRSEVAVPGRRPTWQQRMWARIDQSGGPDACWPWTGYRKPTGYGRLSANGGMYLAHRLAYLDAVGPILDGLVVMHTCDNPPCCNPRHLRLDTQIANMADRKSKHRSKPSGRVGEAAAVARLTNEQVRLIRASTASAAELAEEMGVSRSTVWRVRRGRGNGGWSHVA